MTFLGYAIININNDAVLPQVATALQGPGRTPMVGYVQITQRSLVHANVSLIRTVKKVHRVSTTRATASVFVSPITIVQRRSKRPMTLRSRRLSMSGKRHEANARRMTSLWRGRTDIQVERRGSNNGGTATTEKQGGN